MTDPHSIAILLIAAVTLFYVWIFYRIAAAAERKSADTAERLAHDLRPPDR